MRYQRVYTQVWNDEKFTRLSSGAQLLFLYLLTCPHSNLIGLYILKNGYITEDLNITPQALDKQMQELIDSDMISRCPEHSIIWIPNYLKFNPLTNPNQVTSATNTVNTMPKSQIINDFITHLKGLPEGLDKGLREHLVSVSVLESVLVSEEVKEEKKNYKKERAEIIEDLNEVLGSNYMPTTKAIYELIDKRLEEGHTVEHFRVVHRNMKRAWEHDTKMSTFLRPQTLYTGKFSSYLNWRFTDNRLSSAGMATAEAARRFMEEDNVE